MAEGLELEALGEFGALYWPAGDRPCPTVIVLHGAEGPGAGWAHRFAAILAAHGIGALALGYGEGDMFGAGAIREVDLGGTLRAVEALAAHERALSVGIFGWSKGAEHALLFASLAPEAGLRAVAAFAPRGTVGEAFDPGAAWPPARDAVPAPDAPRAWVWEGKPAAFLAPGARIEVERIGAPVWLGVGTEDSIVDPEETAILAERLEKAGREVEVAIFEGENHALSWDAEPELWARLVGFFDEVAR